jgi:hypothetical protein
MTRPRPDFINIRLSAAGLKRAGEAGTVGWANSRRHFHFAAGEIYEVERSYEWNHLLRHEFYEGQPLLEEVLEEVEIAPEAGPEPEMSAQEEELPKDGE